MIRAEADLTYFRKFLYMAIAFAAFALYCLYDARVAYPKKLEIAEAYESFDDDEAGRREWIALAESRGWSTSAPKKTAEQVRGDIGSQYWMLAAAGIGSFVLLCKWASAKGGFMEGDETHIRTSDGKRIDLDNITGIDRKKWESKGIAVLHHTTGGGPRRFVIDDYKYDRQPAGKLLAIAERRLADRRGDEPLRDHANASEPSASRPSDLPA